MERFRMWERELGRRVDSKVYIGGGGRWRIFQRLMTFLGGTPVVFLGHFLRWQYSQVSAAVAPFFTSMDTSQWAVGWKKGGTLGGGKKWHFAASVRTPRSPLLHHPKEENEDSKEDARQNWLSYLYNRGDTGSPPPLVPYQQSAQSSRCDNVSFTHVSFGWNGDESLHVS